MSTPTSGPLEAKVKWASIISYLAGVGLLGLLNATSTANLIAGLPDVVEAFVAPLVPALAALAAGWKARHTPRPDLRQA